MNALKKHFKGLGSFDPGGLQGSAGSETDLLWLPEPRSKRVQGLGFGPRRFWILGLGFLSFVLSVSRR